jgi:hypothetical protein
VRLADWPVPRTKELLATLTSSGATYGSGDYTGLVSPTTIVIDRPARDGIGAASRAVWRWMEACQRIYGELLATEPRHPVVRAFEWGLPAGAAQLQRDPAVRALRPSAGRIDAVTVHPVVQVAEVQWKGGGEGFLAGVERAQRQVGPSVPGAVPFAPSLDGWVRYFRSRKVEFVTSVGRDAWQNSNRLLEEALAAAGIGMRLIAPGLLERELRLGPAGVEVRHGRLWRRLDYLWGDRLHDSLSPDTVTRLHHHSLDGRLIVDPPLSYLYTQKVALALPFMAEFADRFTDDVRTVLIPSALVLPGQPPELEAVAAAVGGTAAARLRAVERWEDLPRLPRSVRERLVVKCASADPATSSRGRGVIQLGGSGAMAASSWQPCWQRVSQDDEPWLIQPYVSQKFLAPLAHPSAPGDIQVRPVHTRIAIFCGDLTGDAQPLGAIGNVSPYWKVAGKDAGWDQNGRVTGSAFVDLQVDESGS